MNLPGICVLKTYTMNVCQVKVSCEDMLGESVLSECVSSEHVSDESMLDEPVLSRTRGHEAILVKDLCRLDIRKDKK